MGNIMEINILAEIKKTKELPKIRDNLFYLFVDNDIIVNSKENITIKDLKTSKFLLNPKDDFSLMFQYLYSLYKMIKEKYPKKDIRYFKEIKIKTARIKITENIKTGIPNYIYRNDKFYTVLFNWKRQNFIGIKEPSEKDEVLEVD
jgi:hypothetical protein